MSDRRVVSARLRGRRARGAVLIELALVAPILLGLFGAAIDLGMAFRVSRDAVEVVRSAARAEANLGRDRQADREALLAIVAGLGDIEVSNIGRVIVYKAGDGTDGPPSACLDVMPTGQGGGVVGLCNVYTSGQLQNPVPARFGGSSTACESDDWDRWYCPLNREASQGALAGADFVGVWIEVEVDWVVGFLPGDGPTVRERAAMRIEPRVG